MGVIQSVFCSITYCFERVLTWTCCAFVLIMLMCGIIVLMIYGISVGYHYAQKELASFAMSSRTTTEINVMRQGENQQQPAAVVRLVAVNRTQVENGPQPVLEIYQTKKPGQNLYMEASETPVVVLETERPPHEPELSAHEKELARKLIGRFRRSRNNITSTTPFFRPLKNSTLYIN